jgi:Fe-S-cluster-containing hydrogenase component 2
MKTNIPFFSRKLCTGCLRCEMSCSLLKTKECSREGSLIKVFLHPYLSTPMVSVSIQCDCPDGQEKCLPACNQEALKFVPQEESTMMLTQVEWFPCPIT